MVGSIYSIVSVLDNALIVIPAPFSWVGYVRDDIYFLLPEFIIAPASCFELQSVQKIYPPLLAVHKYWVQVIIVGAIVVVVVVLVLVVVVVGAAVVVVPGPIVVVDVEVLVDVDVVEVLVDVDVDVVGAAVVVVVVGAAVVVVPGPIVVVDVVVVLVVATNT